MTKMRLSSYTFITKNGKRYTCSSANNKYEARRKLEWQWHIDLTGASYEERYGAKVLSKGIEQ